MPRRPRSMCRREAIALTAVGIGAWGEVAKAADTVTLTLGGAAWRPFDHSQSRASKLRGQLRKNIVTGEAGGRIVRQSEPRRAK